MSKHNHLVKLLRKKEVDKMFQSLDFEYVLGFSAITLFILWILAIFYGIYKLLIYFI